MTFATTLRIALLFGLALAALPLLRRHAAGTRRLVLALAFAAALVVPFVPALERMAPYHALVGRLVSEPAVAAVAAPLAVAVTTRIDWLFAIWAAGAALVAARLVVAHIAARRLARGVASWDAAVAEAEARTGIRAAVRLADTAGPAVTGVLSPIVLVPASSAAWTHERRVAVLLHELAHVAAHDLAVQLLAGIVCSLHWFNPLVWIAARRLRLERELAADEAVLRAGVRASTYAADLVAIAGSAGGLGAGAIAMGEKPLLRRVRAIVAAERPTALGRTGRAALALGVTATASAAACFASSAQAEEPAHAAIDARLQAIASEELAATLKAAKATSGTVLVLAPNGDVLADAGGASQRDYVAGSTMKAVLLAAALDANAVRETDAFDSTASGPVHDASPIGHAALADLLAVSSNQGFAQVFDRLGGARYDAALRRFHFPTPAGLASSTAGDPGAELTAIGATMTATPARVARAYAALAHGGDGIVSASAAERTGRLLENVVASDRGTGKKARVAGHRVAGKTGTSEWTAPDGTTHGYASFVGWVPAEAPRYVIFVGIDTAGAGGEVAAPAFARIATRALAK